MAGIQFHRSKGQRILKNSSLIGSVVEKSGIKFTDIILEIGPGTGNLTEKLLIAGKSVIAVEIDPRMVLILQRRFEGTHRLQIIQGNVLMVELPYFDICVSNIPYQISAPVINKLLNHRPAFRCAVLMFQRKFGLRLVAQPGDALYCRLSVNTQLFARVSHLLKVGNKCFTPAPKVVSSVVRIEPRIPIPQMNFSEWDGLIRICFNRKNMTIGSIFKQESVLSLLEKEVDDETQDVHPKPSDFFKDKVIGVLKEGGYEEKRSSNLAQADFMHLLSLFNKAGIHFS